MLFRSKKCDHNGNFECGRQVNSLREKRFLLFMPEYVMGGAETQFRYFIRHAEKNQWNLDVIIEHRYRGENTLLNKDATQMKNVRFYVVDKCGNDRNEMFRGIIKIILKNLRHVKYTSCLLYDPLYLDLVFALRILGIYTIYSERVDAAAILGNERWTKSLRYCNRILANSRHAQRQLESASQRKVGLIRNGKPFVEQLEIKKSRELQRVLVPARIVPHKNQIFLLHFLKEYPGFKGKIIFAGVTENRSYQGKLIDYVNKYHLEKQVEFLGYVENMQEEYEKADIIILPSLAEGTPNVVLEAYAYGRPIIVSDIEAERELVTNPHMRFQLNKVNEINSCIEYVRSLSDEDYYKMIQRNRNFVLRNYDMEKMVRQFYKALTERNRVGSRK